MKKIVDEWAKKGHRCVVIAPFPLITYLNKRIEFKPKHYRDEIAPGIYVDIYNPRYLNPKLKFGDFSITAWQSSRAVERLIKRIGVQFDFIYCHFFNSALKGFKYAKQHNIPFFVATGESDIEVLRKPYPKFSWEQFRSFTKGVIAVSSKNKTEAANIGYIDENKCKVFPNGTDPSLFKPLDRDVCRKKLGLPLDAFIVSCVGFICERKGQNRILEAVRKLQNDKVKVMFMGAAAKVETFPLEGAEILFKDSVVNKDLPMYLCASDVFCLPTRAEGCCNAIVEALACGLPIISSNLPFNWDVLDDTNSIMVDPNNIEDIAEAISNLFNDSEKRKELSSGALRKSESLNIKKRAENIMAFIIDQK